MLNRRIVPMFLFVFITFGSSAEETKWSLSDGYKISVNIKEPVDDQIPTRGQILLLHQCNRDKKMWNSLTQKLVQIGFRTVSLDYRGYGESKRLNPSYKHAANDREKFRSDAQEFYALWNSDVEKSQVKFIIGASCGAGLSVSLANSGLKIDGLVLISPALRDFWAGKNGLSDFWNQSQIPVVAIVAKNDHPEIDNVRGLINNYKGKIETKILDGNKHGAPLFNEYPGLMNDILHWIEKSY